MKYQPENTVRILVVDDEQIIRDGCSRILAKEGYTVMTAGSGEEALERFDLEPSDLVLLDVKMPGMGGIETLRGLKEMV